ncbi:hypothetical protein DBR47_19515 [Paucibacter sp. KBW04]|nr:hypothetical protein DBR47_19515 [Paucibacter sp. KBW04]
MEAVEETNGAKRKPSTFRSFKVRALILEKDGEFDRLDRILAASYAALQYFLVEFVGSSV